MSDKPKSIALNPSMAIKFYRVSNNGVDENVMAIVEYVQINGQPGVFQVPIASSSEQIPQCMQDLVTLLAINIKTLLRQKIAIMPLNILPAEAPEPEIPATGPDAVITPEQKAAIDAAQPELPLEGAQEEPKTV